MNVDVQQYQAWVGRTEESEDWITPTSVRGVQAMFDMEPVAKAGDPLPPGWHFFYNNPIAPASQLGRDGHPKRGGFLPPVELPRRMWAGSKLAFNAPLRVGDTLKRSSEILSVQGKTGSTGSLVFVGVRHTLRSSSGGETVDEQRIVYREDPKDGANAAPAKKPALPEGAEFSVSSSPDPVMLYRFSALTFNGHRIHYDHPYVTGVEGYPGLVVHGPLIALSMLQAFTGTHPGVTVRGYDFTPRSPITVPMEMTAQGRKTEQGWDLWMLAGGSVASVASLTI
jgi:3-methylfumaryl-CoA hydratase